MVSTAGCDSIVYIDLIFNDSIVEQENYSGCTSDGYSITVNNTVYDVINPSGREEMVSAAGCDSVVYIDLHYTDTIFTDALYTGCVGDGYALMINGTSYNESNSQGVEVLTSMAGCDSVVNIDLNFMEMMERQERFEGCMGDGYFVIINNVRYDENNPTGTELITGGAACDTIVLVDLIFHKKQSFHEKIEINDQSDRLLDIGFIYSQLDSIVSVLWSPADWLSCATCMQPEYVGQGSGDLYLEIIDDVGCVHEIMLEIILIESNSIYIPNVFTPNGDGVNDIFIPMSDPSRDIQVLSFEIFDRWGGKVFSRGGLSITDERLGWDGTIGQKKEAASGLYVYVLQIDGEGNIPDLHYGEVTLLR